MEIQKQPPHNPSRPAFSQTWRRGIGRVERLLGTRGRGCKHKHILYELVVTDHTIHGQVKKGNS